MSGVAAAICRDGSDCVPALSALIEGGRHRAPDGVTTWIGAGAGLARLHRFVFCAQSAAAQPAVGRDSGLVVVFDGRLDERDALAARLSRCPACDDDDVEYALRAVEDRGA